MRRGVSVLLGDLRYGLSYLLAHLRQCRGVDELGRHEDDLDLVALPAEFARNCSRSRSGWMITEDVRSVEGDAVAAMHDHVPLFANGAPGAILDSQGHHEMGGLGVGAERGA
jgi:hypothetical protein